MSAKKKYLSFIASVLIAFVALFGVVLQDVFAQSPFVPIFHTGAPGSGSSPGSSFCGPCSSFFAKNPNAATLNNLVDSNAIRFNYVNRDFSSPLGHTGSIPILEYAPGQFMHPSDPGFAEKLAEIGKQVPQQQDEKICIVPRPGQSPEFGFVTDQPEKYKPWGTLPDLGPLLPEDLTTNFPLRSLGSGTMEEELARAQEQKVEGGTTKVIKPNKTQALEYIASMKGNKLARGSYKIKGTDVPVGKYRANQADQLTGIKFDENCDNPKKEPLAPDPAQANPGGANPGFGGLRGNPGGGGGGGFGGGGGGLGGGAGGALGALLPALMQGLMGGGQQGQGQNQYGAGYGNQQTCDTQAIAPVCGTDGKTYKNQCFLNQQSELQGTGVTVRNTGVCAASLIPSAPPTPAINSIVTLTQLAQSGIPAALLDNVRNLVSSVLSGIVSGANISETVVQ